MTKRESARYRLEVAERSLDSAKENLTRERWRDAAMFARATVEHATKAIAACVGNVPKTHEPTKPLEAALEDASFPSGLRARAEALEPILADYGMAAHIELAYGDEKLGIDPWKIVTADRARRDVGVATDCVTLARDCMTALFGEDKPA